MRRLMILLAALCCGAAARAQGAGQPLYRAALSGRTLPEVAAALERDYGVRTVIARPSDRRGEGALQAGTLQELVAAILEQYRADGFLVGELLAVDGAPPPLPAPEAVAADSKALAAAAAEMLRPHWERLPPVPVPAGAQWAIVPVELAPEEADLVRRWYDAEAEERAARLRTPLRHLDQMFLRWDPEALALGSATSSVPLGPTRAEGEVAPPATWRRLFCSPPGADQLARMAPDTRVVTVQVGC
ncbi:MAG: hypothetical protein HY321_13735 [Armatimonadetes bacterium]|nr:hypothetical protein [Armatimonadota bacterium]